MKINTGDISTIPELTPPKDETFVTLLEAALEGRVEVYFAAVRPRDIVPLSASYDPESHPVGRQAVDEVMNRWRQGNFSAIWLYEEEGHFVMSDDYVVWAAVKRGQPDFVPAYILGKPASALVDDLQGPLTIQAVRTALGFA